MAKLKEPAEPISVEQAIEAQKVVTRFLRSKKPGGVKASELRSAQRIVNAYVRQHEAETREQAKRLGFKSPEQVVRALRETKC